MLNNSADIIRRLKREGFVLKSVRGSHQKFVHETTKRMVVVTHPRRDIPIGTVHAIYKDAGWERD
ncbi:Predicted RNA binding protein YcfA, dsRBD-like fold, HicA-like mRNA interferase family [Bosea lupini]|uniref:Predicted RNA binding protein YcfA, dsRBD-like fold, HicA-like mRNA interferase family n=1 Tax=Bosea lupini TaxID=1036779 RepID=A0A1H7X0J1_9HYPH|nr:type II toxin-antitoxin system HicA family toxin [Bosea lupini]SEM27323.1 Predicted RNA binding protein YcfA, dsRBD-like fold, HicA-like mRNA interferase family [Bosea lupini]